MVTILDKRPRHPEKAHKPDTPVLRKPDWIRVKVPASSPQFAETRAILREHGLHHGVRGGRLPQHRRVLGRAARHHDDHGRHLHARLRLLQRQDRAAGRARCGRAGQRRAGGGEAGARSHRHHLGRSRRPGRRRRRAFRRHHPRHPRADAEDHHRGADAGFPAQGRRAGDGRRGGARRLQPQPRDGARRSTSRSGPARATSIRCACCSG